MNAVISILACHGSREARQDTSSPARPPLDAMSAANTPDSSRLAQAFDEFVKSTQKENTAFRKEILKRDQATARKLDVLQTELTRTKEDGVARKSVAENTHGSPLTTSRL